MDLIQEHEAEAVQLERIPVGKLVKCRVKIYSLTTAGNLLIINMDSKYRELGIETVDDLEDPNYGSEKPTNSDPTA